MCSTNNCDTPVKLENNERKEEENQENDEQNVIVDNVHDIIGKYSLSSHKRSIWKTFSPYQSNSSSSEISPLSITIDAMYDPNGNNFGLNSVPSTHKKLCLKRKLSVHHL